MQAVNPRIMMFAPMCFPPTGSEAIVACKLLLAGQNDGWKLDVITQVDAGLHYPARSEEEGDWHPIVHVIHQIEGGREKGLCAWLSKRYPAANYLRSIAWVIKATWLGWRLSRQKRYDFILSRAAPQYGHFPALILSRLLGIRWLVNWSDPMPSCKAPPPYGRGIRAPLAFYLSGYYSALTSYADFHTFPCERLRKYVCSYFPQCEEKSAVIPHIALPKTTTRTGSDSFVLCHPGGMSMRSPEVFLRGVRRFAEANASDRHRMQIRFFGCTLDAVAEMTRSLELEDIVCIEEAKPYEDAQRSIAEADVLVVIEAKCEEGIFLPSKFVDFVQAGRPILAVSPRKGTLWDILSEYGGGIAVDNTSPESVAAGLNKLFCAWKEGELDKRFSSAALFRLFSEDTVLDEYRKIFQRLDSFSNA